MILELWASRHPKGQRVTDLIEYAKEILELYNKQFPIFLGFRDKRDM